MGHSDSENSNPSQSFLTDIAFCLRMHLLVYIYKKATEFKTINVIAVKTFFVLKITIKPQKSVGISFKFIYSVQSP